MFRPAAALLLLAVAGPVSAQPVLPKGQPVPIPPQPPTFAVPTMPGGARPGSADGPRLVVAKVVDGSLVWKTTAMTPVTRQVDVPVIENGEQVVRKTTMTTMQQTTRETSLPLEGLKIKDAAGRKVQPLALEIKLGEGGGVLLHSGPLPPELRAMLKDDAILVELPGGPQFAQPVFIGPPPGGQPVAPPVFRPAELPTPTPRPAPPAPPPAPQP